MRKAVFITLGLTGAATAAALLLGKISLGVSLWIGALWGLLNAWCLQLILKMVLNRQRQGWRLALLLVVKLAGLYGLAVWFLVGLRLPPLAWISGFTLSLIGLGISALPLLRAISRIGEAGA